MVLDSTAILRNGYSKDMPFDASVYGSDVVRLLALDGSGDRPLPLTRTAPSTEHRGDILRYSAAHLFPGARAPEAAMAGLLLYFSCWEDAHETAQSLSTPEGSYWHAIVHRQEPDDWNSGYWFRQVGEHAIFPLLAERAATLGVPSAGRWSPFRFIEVCAEARQDSASDLAQRAQSVQLAEWQLLFHYCAAKKQAR